LTDESHARWQTCSLAARSLAGWLVDWLVGWLVDRLVSWLIDWLVG